MRSVGAARVLGATVLACVGLVGTPAQAFTCSVGGSGGEFQVRLIEAAPIERSLGLLLDVDKDTTQLANGSNWHAFGGVWLINRDTGNGSFYFEDIHAMFGPPAVVVATAHGELAQEVPSTGVVLNQPFGRGIIFPTLQPYSDYYLIGFGTGSGTWQGTAVVGGPEKGCPLLDVAGEIFDYDASDFTGGTHLMVPGFGHGEDITLVHDFARSYSVMALFAFMPEPLPPATVRVQGVAHGSPITRTYTQTITSLSWTGEVTFTASYTGQPEDAPLLRLLQVDLDVGL